MGRVTAIVVLVLILVAALLVAQEAPKPAPEPAVQTAPEPAAKTLVDTASKPAVETAAKPSVEKARIIVYRYKQFVGKGLRPSIYCNEKDVARLQSGRYVVLSLPAGKHTLRSNDKQSQFELDVKAGQEYYVRIDIAPGFMKGHGRLTLVAPEQGKGEFQQMKPADADMIKDKEFLASDFAPAT